MSDIDLTEAVARARWERTTLATRRAWSDLPQGVRDRMRSDVNTADIEVIEAAVREQVAREVRSQLPGVLVATAGEEYGWASDMQDAQLRTVGRDGVAFCGEGVVDSRHIASLAASIARGGAA